MEHEPSIFEQRDEAAEALSLERARADYAAGRYHDHATVSAWLRTWGTPNRKSFREWLKSSG
ncbi:putative transcriptional regulator [Sphingomonas sp. SORGH_AS870]|uniref:antitoxin n=1 Tax=Sphingomonas sp. SORGH_AS_0870 TaxID=3041801 RepID=UPI00285CDC10|nr:antitoxin [Sphingomonas sp. SORGH_AS_0870]MDR6147743.1 putative transcriptional regulator [Sphingomonas sp. SORGH_AS_0870]